MNILFVTTNQTAVQKGGTERTTALVSNELRRRGHKCFNLYAKRLDSSYVLTEFDGVLNNFKHNVISEYIDTYCIDRVIFEGAFTLIEKVYSGVKISKMKPKMYFVHHFSPGNEPHFNDFRALYQQFKYGSFIKERTKALIKILIYPVYKPLMDSNFRKLYKVAYDYCDKVVLLCKEYDEGYCAYGRFTDKEKFVAIPNALSFDEFIDEAGMSKKKKSVLIVSRLDEIQKRVSLAIKIWRRIEEDEELKDWRLKIVGTGDFENEYKKQIAKLKLKCITLEGRQNPIPYYKESSIYMGTSLYEGWPMTLNEAAQMGCVSIVYDTCPAFNDIICNGENGYIISEKNEDMYLKTMKKLMQDDCMRAKMGRNAVELSKRFTQEIIIDKWENLLK